MRGVPGLGCSWIVCWVSWPGDLAWDPPIPSWGGGRSCGHLTMGMPWALGRGGPGLGVCSQKCSGGSSPSGRDLWSAGWSRVL